MEGSAEVSTEEVRPSCDREGVGEGPEEGEEGGVEGDIKESNAARGSEGGLAAGAEGAVTGDVKRDAEGGTEVSVEEMRLAGGREDVGDGLEEGGDGGGRGGISESKMQPPSSALASPR